MISQSPVYKATIGDKSEVLANTQTTTLTVVKEVSENNLTVVEGESSSTEDSKVADVDESGSEDEQETSGTVIKTEIKSDIKSTGTHGK